ncbi:MAG: conjugal transfer protein TraF [Nitrospiria bacterium]
MFAEKISLKTLNYLIWVFMFLIHLTKLVHAQPLDELKTFNSERKISEAAIEEKVDLELPKGQPLAFERPYYQNREEGWFWYIQPPKEEVKKKKISKPKKIEPKDFNSKWPNFKHAEEVHAYLNELKDKAVMNPTTENIKEYLEFQKYVMSKARLFSDITQRVIWSNPDLDQSARKPLAEIAQPIMVNEKIEDTGKKLKEISEKGGVFFFFLSTCPYCHMEAPLLKQLEEVYGIKVIPVSLDGPGLPGFSNPIFDRDHLMAQALNVQKTPTLFFGKPPKEIRRIANGFVSFPELIERIISVSEGVEYND